MLLPNHKYHLFHINTRAAVIFVVVVDIAVVDAADTIVSVRNISMTENAKSTQKTFFFLLRNRAYNSFSYVITKYDDSNHNKITFWATIEQTSPNSFGLGFNRFSYLFYFSYFANIRGNYPIITE